MFLSPSSPTVALQIQSVRRRMRGGSQAFLIEGCDKEYYVAKFAGNPQGTRTLINEWICYRLLQKVGVCTPELRFLHLTADTVQRTPDLAFTMKTTVPILPGLHLGSRCPANPEQVAIYDFLPSKMLADLVNREDFSKVLAVDVFTGQADSRQAIFLKEKGFRKARFRAYFIDHGQAFGGSEWKIRDLARLGRYHDPRVYEDLHTGPTLQTAICALEEFSKQEFYRIVNELPGDWWQIEDSASIAEVWIQLEKRQFTLRNVLERALADCGKRDSLRCVVDVPLSSGKDWRRIA